MSAMRRAFSDAFTFTRSSSSPKTHSKVEKRLGLCLPAVDWPVYDDNGDIKAFNGWHVFGSETSRTHFIKHVLILLSENGKNDLSNLHFDNFFARSYDKAGVIWYTASIVVTAPGDYKIRHSIAATRAGTTKTAAFQLLMLDVETKLDAVLRGNGLNSAALPGKQSKRKESSSAVSIITTPSEAMAPPKVETDDYNTWSGAPLTTSPKSKASTQFSHSSKGSQSTQKSSASSKYSQGTQSSQSTAPSTPEPVTSNLAYKASQASLTTSTPTPEPLQHARHASTPPRSITPTPAPTPEATKHISHQLQPRSPSAPPTIIKALPALPRSSTDKPPIASEPENIHPALRRKSASTEGLKPIARSNEGSIAGSSVYSRSPVSPLDDAEKEVQPLVVVPVVPAHSDIPSPLHFEKPIAKLPARFLRQQTEFEIYV